MNIWWWVDRAVCYSGVAIIGESALDLEGVRVVQCQIQWAGKGRRIDQVLNFGGLRLKYSVVDYF